MRKSIYKKYEQLREMYDEASAALSDYNDMRRDHYYLSEFICYKNLEHEFEEFKERAIEISDEEDPFPHLIVK